METLPFLIVGLSTVFFLRRTGYGWIGSILTGLLASPLLYLVVLALVQLSLNLGLGGLTTGDQRENNPQILFMLSSSLVVALWLIAGYVLFTPRIRSSDKSLKDP